MNNNTTTGTKRYNSFDRNGNPIKMSVPETYKALHASPTIDEVFPRTMARIDQDRAEAEALAGRVPKKGS